MTTLSWTVPLVPADGSVGPRLDRHGIWQGMEDKAENPTPYVPYITGCEILERYPDGILREITYRDRGRVVERVIYEPEERMIFRPSDDPEVSEIVNEIGAEDGSFTFTLKVTLSAAAEERSERDPAYLKALSDLFSSSLKTIVAATLSHNTTK